MQVFSHLLKLLLFVSLFGTTAKASVWYSDTIFTSHFNYSNRINYDKKLYIPRDTGITGIQNYHPASGKDNYLFNGIIGQAVMNFDGNFNYRPGVNLGPDPFSIYYKDFQRLQFYDTKRPFTRVFFLAGSKKEQDADILHTQNINNNWNLGFEFARYKTDGNFQRQNSNFSNVRIFSSYNNKANNYHALYQLHYNKLTVYENGGILYPDDFQASGFSNKALLDINLFAASNERRNHGYFTAQQFDFGKIASTKTTDTASKTDYYEYAFRFQIESSMQRYSRKFKDNNPDSSFYSSLNYNPVYSFDSIFFQNNKNSLSLQNLNRSLSGKQNKLFWTVGISHQLFQYYQFNRYDNLYNISKNRYLGGLEDYNLISDGNLRYSINKSTQITAIADYVALGYNRGDGSAELNFVYQQINDSTTTSNKPRLTLSLQSESRKAALLYQEFYSNSLNWDKNLLSIQKQLFTALIEFPTLNASIRLTGENVQNHVYLSNSLQPLQLTAPAQVLSLQVKKHFRLKKFNWITCTNLRKSSSLMIPLPAVVSNNSFFIETSLFKKAGIGQIGIDLWYSTAFYSYVYRPDAAMYFNQYSSKTGGYPFIDFFINAKISSVKVFIKTEHLNAGLMGNTYYQTLNNPMQDRMFKLGIIWDFHN